MRKIAASGRKDLITSIIRLMIVSRREPVRRIFSDLFIVFSRDGILTGICTKIARRGIRSQAGIVLINITLRLTVP
jgi:hypothetical protein